MMPKGNVIAMIGLSVLIIFGTCLVALSLNEKKEESLNVETLIIKLADNDIATRSAAEKELITRGEEARLLLEQATKNDNKTIAASSKRILEIINNINSAPKP